MTIAGMLLIGLAFPNAVRADICGGTATVEPRSGPEGTTFVFRTNQGAPTNFNLNHDGILVGTGTLAGDGFVSHRIHTVEGAAGAWRVRAAVQGHEECYGEAKFRVTSIPDTATAEGGPTASAWLVTVLVGIVASMLGWRRFATGRA